MSQLVAWLFAALPLAAQVNLSWTDNSHDEHGFQIERALASDMKFAQHATVAANVTTYSDAGALASISYAYRVAAFNQAGISEYSNTVIRQAGVTSSNTAPTISDIPNLTIAEDAATPLLAFVIGDAQTAPQNLTVSATSSNPALVPSANLVLGGSGANRTLQATPAPNQFGTSTITVTVSDSALTATDQFDLTVTSQNDRPTIGNVASQTILQGGTTGPLAFAIGDVETPAGNLLLSAASSNSALVPSTSIVFGGAGVSRTVTVTPVASQSGTATITITVSDGSLTATSAFGLTVNSVNQPPTISALADITLHAGVSTTVPFTVSDRETAAGSLGVSATSSNLTLVPAGNLVLGGTGGSRTLTITPALDRTGTTTITVRVSDGAAVASVSFVVTVTSVPPPPWMAVDVGEPAVAGYCATTGNGFRVAGGGGDTGGSADQFHYLHQSGTGDCEIVARVVSVDNTNSPAKAGIMIRESTTTSARYAGIFVTPENGLSAQARLTTGGSTSSKRKSAVTAPQWLRLRRVGHAFMAAHSHDGVTWVEVQKWKIKMGPGVTIGLAVTSANTTTLSVAAFENVSATP